jgi:hypothetical protein
MDAESTADQLLGDPFGDAASGSSRRPSASRTPLPPKPSTAATTSIEPSRIASITSASTSDGTWFVRAYRVNGPSTGTGNPNSDRSPMNRACPPCDRYVLCAHI